MVQREVLIQNKLGLHARAAAKLARTASTFQSDIHLARLGRNEFVNGKSVLGILMIAARAGTRLRITASGSDETAAVAALEALINNRFGERE
ncbi:MAG: HPr family phosphocarrier protein [Acidobacteria bacterium]|nr:HPr family phosphocarrier protein [Acidobacteriota bacterium]